MRPAAELHERALEATNTGRFSVARRLLDRAAQSAGDPDLAARIALTRIYVDAETGAPEAALAAGLRLLETTTGLTRETVGRIWSQVALIQTISGDHPVALASYAEAERLLEEAPEPLGRVLLNRGNLHLQRGDVPAAVRDLTAAADQNARAGTAVDRAKAEHNLGYALLLAGDLIGALQRMESAALVLAGSSTIARAVGEQDRAEVLLAAGQPREAVVALEAAIAAYGARRLRRFQADCELVLATTLLREEPRRARTVARRAGRRFRAGSRDLPGLRADAIALQAEVAAGSRRRALVVELDDHAASLRAMGHRHEAALLEVTAARMELRLGRIESAQTRLTTARPTPHEPLSLRLARREVRAEAAQARGHHSRARGHVRSGLAELHDWQSAFGSFDLQSSLVGHGRRLAVLGLESALADGRPELVLEWSERARQLTSRVAPVRPPADPALAADLTELRLTGAAPPGRSAAARRYEELRRRIRSRSWYGAGGGAVAEPVDLDQLTATLAETDTALVAHLAGGPGEVTALVVTGTDARVIALPAGGVGSDLAAVTADLDMIASDWDGPFGAPVRASLAAGLARLSAALSTPLSDLIGDRRVVLTPSGILAGTPWSLLDGLTGRPVTVATSATRWLALHDRERAVPRRATLVAGPGVPRSAEEIDRAAALWDDPAVLRGAAATVARVTEASDCDVLHIAGHGRHSGEHPLFSGLELVDGPLFGYDIDQLDAVPDTVVLSACELGRASTRSGEETVGMTAAWLHAGARTVISSPAVVADDVACDVLSAWHRHLRAGRSPAEALVDATAELSPGSAPSPFVCFGAG